MFAREALEKLAQDKDAFQTVQNEANNPHDPKHLQSKLKLGLCQVYGFGIDKNIVRGFENIFDIYFLGERWYLEKIFGILTSKTFFSAETLQVMFQYYHSQQDKPARTQMILGFCYQNGIGVLKNLEIAFGLYMKSAERGNAPAQNALAICYLQGKGVPKNEQLAIEWFTVSASQKYAPAECNLTQQRQHQLLLPQMRQEINRLRFMLTERERLLEQEKIKNSQLQLEIEKLKNRELTNMTRPTTAITNKLILKSGSNKQLVGHSALMLPQASMRVVDPLRMLAAVSQEDMDENSPVVVRNKKQKRECG